MRKILLLIISGALLTGLLLFIHKQDTKTKQIEKIQSEQQTVKDIPITMFPSSPLSILALRNKEYEGSELEIIQTLNPTANYNKYLTSYTSEGLTINALLTVPKGQKPEFGWPVIILNHGYIPPKEYSTEKSYTSFVNQLANEGYIVFKPDFRGNGDSEGEPKQPYVSPDYIVDSMNALETIKKYPDADPQRIAVLGHSMGGNITLRQLVISKEIKAAVILSGVVGSYPEILTWFNMRSAAGVLETQNDKETALGLVRFVQENGMPDENPLFWQPIDPINFLSDVSAPVQIQVGVNDEVVPPNFSRMLNERLKQAEKIVEFHEYSGADHNLSPNTGAALNQAIIFFDTYLK